MSTKRFISLTIPILIGLTPIIFASCVGVPDLSTEMSHQGRLLDSTGAPVVDGNYNFRYRIYHAATSGTPVYTETKTVAVSDGLFDTTLGTTGVITPDIFAQPSWIEIAVNGETLTPRQKLLGAPYAFSLAAGAVVQGGVPITRTFSGVENTGSVLTVWNDNSGIKGGHSLVVLNQAAAEGINRDTVAALWVKAAGGNTSASPYSGAYGAIVTSDKYRGLYAKGGTIDEIGSDYAAGVFSSDYGIILEGGGVCHGCAMAYFAQNAGADAIQPGDFVAALGVAVDPDLNVPVMMVAKASRADEAIVGVASTAVSRAPVEERQGIRTGGFDPRAGQAAPGEYLSVVVQGLVQARVGEVQVQAGDWLTFQDSALAAAPAGSVGLARAMSTPDPDGMVWVLYNGQ